MDIRGRFERPVRRLHAHDVAVRDPQLRGGLADRSPPAVPRWSSRPGRAAPAATAGARRGHRGIAATGRAGNGTGIAAGSPSKRGGGEFERRPALDAEALRGRGFEPEAALARHIVVARSRRQQRLDDVLGRHRLVFDAHLAGQVGQRRLDGARVVQRLDERRGDRHGRLRRDRGHQRHFGFERVVVRQQQVGPGGGVVQKRPEGDHQFGARQGVRHAARTRQRV